jgi:hypothetical protein
MSYKKDSKRARRRRTSSLRVIGSSMAQMCSSTATRSLSSKTKLPNYRWTSRI